MKELALKVPEDTREMTDMINFIKEAKTSRLVKLNEQIKVSLVRKFYAFVVLLITFYLAPV